MTKSQSTSWTIVGCGYTGERLAARLGACVVTTRSRNELAARLPQARVVVADPAALPADAFGEVVVDSVPGDSSHIPPLVAAAARAGTRRVVYLSATSVYGQGHGEWIDEDSPTRGDTARGRARLEAEHALHAAADAHGIESVALRIAAIYGPGRGVVARMRAGSYRVIGDGDTWMNRIHVDDLVSVILAAGSIDPLPRRTYVVADDEPTTTRAYADAAAAALGLPPPPSVPVTDVSPEAAEMALGNRRIRNTRLHSELGVTLRYPTWREGLVA